MFPGWSSDRSELRCAETYFHDLPGSQTSSLGFLHASSFFNFISGCLQNHSMTSVWMSTSTGFCNILSYESLLNSNIFISHESNFVFYLDALMTRLTFGLNAPKHIHKDTKNKTITHVSVRELLQTKQQGDVRQVLNTFCCDAPRSSREETPGLWTTSLT